jgi:phenylacetic acid degradation operon negative regulatory protein
MHGFATMAPVVVTDGYPGNRDGEPVLPAASARSLLITVVGEMLKDSDEGVWTTALLRVFGGLGIEDHAGRQLLARSAAVDWVARERQGRGVRWRLAERGQELVDGGVRRSQLYLEGGEEWDERWLFLYVTVPQQQRTTRARLYGGLSWLGMGNPTPGVWVTPHAGRVDELRRLVSTLGLEDTSLAVVGHLRDIGLSAPTLVQRSWDLDALRRQYERFLAQEDGRAELRDPDDVLISYLSLLSLQQRFMRLDPMLPVGLLPDWVGRDGAALFRRLRRHWATAAHERFWEINRASAPA